MGQKENRNEIYKNANYPAIDIVKAKKARVLTKMKIGVKIDQDKI